MPRVSVDLSREADYLQLMQKAQRQQTVACRYTVELSRGVQDRVHSVFMWSCSCGSTLNCRCMVVTITQGWIRATNQKEVRVHCKFDMHLLIDYPDWNFVRKNFDLI